MSKYDLEEALNEAFFMKKFAEARSMNRQTWMQKMTFRHPKTTSTDYAQSEKLAQIAITNPYAIIWSLDNGRWSIVSFLRKN